MKKTRNVSLMEEIASNIEGNLNSHQIALLSAAEEAYSAAAGVLQPALLKMQKERLQQFDEAFHIGLHLLEEAMKAHNQYRAGLPKL